MSRNATNGWSLIGNDIVDLQYFEAPARSHIQYLDRVCTAAEAQFVRRSECASTKLAMVWAAKEAAFKLVSKELGLAHFVPREFETVWAGCCSRDLNTSLDVLYSDMQISVSVTANEQWAHATATFPGAGICGWKVAEINKCRLDQSKARDESEAVRSLARRFLAECGRDELLEFVARVPTLRREHCDPRELDISLSHHGRFAAVALGGFAPVGADSMRTVRHLMQYASSGGQCSTYMA